MELGKIFVTGGWFSKIAFSGKAYPEAKKLSRSTGPVPRARRRFGLVCSSQGIAISVKKIKKVPEKRTVCKWNSGFYI
jgi:hypothetical protein